MAEFCPKCGKLLAEGEECDCVVEVAEEATVQIEAAPEEAVENTNVQTYKNAEEPCCVCKRSIKEVIKCFFKEPLTCTLTAYKQISFFKGMLLVLIEAITAGLFSIVLVSFMVGGASGFVPYVDKLLGLGGLFRYWGISVHVPYFEIFIKVFLLVFIMFYILVGLFYIAGKLFGYTEGSFKLIISVLSITSLINSAGFILSAILLPFLPSCIPLILIFTFVFRVILNNAGSCEVFDIYPNPGVYSTGMVYLLYFLIVNVLTVETLESSLVRLLLSIH